MNAMVEEMQAGNMQENYLSVGSRLSSGKWAHLCEDTEAPIENSDRRAMLAVLLEQQERWFRGLDETVRAVSVGDFQKFAFPLTRAIYPNLIANEIVSVQPMLGPVSLIFYLDFVYGSAKGAVKRGDTAFSAVARGADNPSFTSAQIDGETMTGVTPYQMAYFPAVPGTVTLTDGINVITDNGAGGFVGDVAATPPTINYATGTVAFTTNVFLNPTGQAITATYSYDMEANANIPQLDLIIQSAPVVARSRKLRTSWSLESYYNMRALHGLEAEVELTAAAGAEIKHEIDREVINDLRAIAAAGSVYWMRDQFTGISFTEHKLSIIDAFQTASNLINKATGRGGATFIVGGINVATVVETLPGFQGESIASGLQKGAHRSGRVNGQWDFYKDPFYPDNFFMMGFKGMSFLEAGYVYAPFVPLYTTPTIVLDDFIGRKGLATQYGKKPINPLFYVTGEIGTRDQVAAKSGLAIATNAAPFGSAAELLSLPNGRGVFGV